MTLFKTQNRMSEPNPLSEPSPMSGRKRARPSCPLPALTLGMGGGIGGGHPLADRIRRLPMKQTTLTGRLAASALAVIALGATAPFSLASGPPGEADASELAGEAKVEKHVYSFTEKIELSDDDGQHSTMIISQNEGPTLRIKKSGDGETRVFQMKDGEWVTDGDFVIDEDMQALIDRAEEARVEVRSFTSEDGDRFPHMDKNAKVFRFKSRSGDGQTGDFPAMFFSGDRLMMGAHGVENDLEAAEMLLADVERRLERAKENGEKRSKIRSAQKKLDKAKKALRDAQEMLAEE